MKEIAILGVSAWFHDSAAALLVDGQLVAAAQEERFSRIKHDASFPLNAIRYCLDEHAITLTDITHIVFYEDPSLKFQRLLSTFVNCAPRGAALFATVMDQWLFRKRMIDANVIEILSREFHVPKRMMPRYFHTKHHHSHAASAFFPSPFDEAMVLCVDGVGEWDTTTVWYGCENYLACKKSIRFPHSLGLLYSAFTYYLGFKVNSGEYKLMGLAPYGNQKFVDAILDTLVRLKEDGSFELNMDYFCFHTHRKMIKEKFCHLFDLPVRQSDAALTQTHMDVAKSIQEVTERILVRMVNHMYDTYRCDNLCLAGGVALNCVANSRLLRETPVRNIWVQPAAGDAGGSVGAAMYLWHTGLNKERRCLGVDGMKNAYLGPAYSPEQIEAVLEGLGACYERLPVETLLERVAGLIATGKVVGWFRGRMEFGPRALGNRSIFADPRSPLMQSTLNLKIKKRESFRPFAPVVKLEKAHEWFKIESESPYMLLVGDVVESKRCSDVEMRSGLDRLAQKRSLIPAVTHVDHSARIQTVRKESNAVVYGLLDKFEQLTNVPLLINTSFNERGEPIVCTPEDAYKCFMRTDIDVLVLEDYILTKDEQPSDRKRFAKTFEMD